MKNHPNVFLSAPGAIVSMLVIGVMALEVFSPPTVASAFLYVAIVFAGSLFPARSHVVAIGFVVSSMIIAGFWIGVPPAGDGEITTALVNRALALAGVWLMVMVVMKMQGDGQKLRDLERENAMMAARAEKAAQVKAQFMASMSHELRTPMNAVIGFSEMIEQESPGKLNAGQREYVGYILKSARHMLDLVNGVLELEKIESNEISIRPESIDLKKIIADVAARHAREAAGRNITITTMFDGNAILPGVGGVYADPLRLRQVLSDLLKNAIRYNRNGGKVEIFCDCDRTGFVRISVADTGDGISPEKTDKLFVPFARLGREAGPVEGVGIGLAIARDLVERMGGDIGFESAPGMGSTFWVDIPKDRAMSPVPGPAPDSGFRAVALP